MNMGIKQIGRFLSHETTKDAPPAVKTVRDRLIYFFFLSVFAILLAGCTRVNLDQLGKEQIVVVVVENEIYGPLKDAIEIFCEDIKRDGFSPLTVKFTGTSEQLRDILGGIPRIKGAVFIGNIPYALYEIYDKKTTENFVFPSDLYFMDLNGTWKDSDKNGVFDVHSGRKYPEIWVSRILPPRYFGDRITRIEKYLHKVHEYKSSSAILPSESLLYLDDFKMANGYPVARVSEYKRALRHVTKNITAITKDETTIASDYLGRISKDLLFVRLIAHSGGFGHQFLLNAKNNGKVLPKDIVKIKPRGLFYLITSCGSFDFRRSDYIGGCYLFNGSGLIAIGQSSSFDVLSEIPDVFFRSLAGNNFGEAFRKWIQEGIRREVRPECGLNAILLGDGTIGIR